MKAGSQLLLALFAIGSAAMCDAADTKAAKARVEQVCQACHGIDGNSAIADNPKLGGQYPDYLAKALSVYLSGLRKNPIMDGFADKSFQQDIANLASHSVEHPAVRSTKPLHLLTAVI